MKRGVWKDTYSQSAHMEFRINVAKLSNCLSMIDSRSWSRWIKVFLQVAVREEVKDAKEIAISWCWRWSVLQLLQLIMFGWIEWAIILLHGCVPPRLEDFRIDSSWPASRIPEGLLVPCKFNDKTCLPIKARYLADEQTPNSSVVWDVQDYLTIWSRHIPQIAGRSASDSPLKITNATTIHTESIEHHQWRPQPG